MVDGIIAVHRQAIKSVTFRNCSHNIFHVWLLVASVFPTSSALEVGMYSFEFIAIQVAAGRNCIHVGIGRLCNGKKLNLY